MSKLFQPFKSNALNLKNHIVMAPLTRNRSPNNIANELNRLYYSQRASAGLIISEGTAISQEGQGYIDVPGLYSKEQLAGWKQVTNAVHEKGSKIFAQIWHVGRISHTSLQPNGAAPVAPSAIKADAHTYIRNDKGEGEFASTSEPRALRLDEINRIIEDYKRAAKGAVEEGGFDGVEIHAANGYLLDSFMRENSNQRNDDYGGSIENRIRLTLEVVEAVISEIGAHRTAIRISPVTPVNDAHDNDPQPLFDALIDELAAYDLAYIHIIEGATGASRNYQEAPYPFDYHRLRQHYRDAGGKAAWIANNGYNRAMAEEAIDSGYADLVAFGRPFIANPDFVERLKQNGPFNELKADKLYGQGTEGYTDYPTLDKA